MNRVAEVMRLGEPVQLMLGKLLGGVGVSLTTTAVSPPAASAPHMRRTPPRRFRTALPWLFIYRIARR
jgi:hypothetical protein